MLMIFLMTPLGHAACLELDPQQITIEWTAFKTPSKVGVRGTLPKFDLQGKTQGPDLKEILSQLGIHIDPSRIHTGNASRDKKIARFFFGKMKGKIIKAQVKKIKSKEIILKVQMNEYVQEIPMQYKIKGHQIEGSGFLDILDFQAHSALQSLNKACRALHSGKTWSDVLLKIKAHFRPCSQTP